MTARLIAVYGRVAKLVSHLHLPVQSGSDRVLAAMKRGYTALEYKSIVRRLRAERPDLSLTSDFIVGFPGETEADFAQTLKLVDDIALRRRVQLRLQRRAPARRPPTSPTPVPGRRAAGAARAAAGAARRPVPRLQRGDGRHPAARAGDRPRGEEHAGARRRAPATTASSTFPATPRSSAATSTSRSPCGAAAFAARRARRWLIRRLRRDPGAVNAMRPRLSHRSRPLGRHTPASRMPCLCRRFR